jgi:hypothetical protein
LQLLTGEHLDFAISGVEKRGRDKKLFACECDDPLFDICGGIGGGGGAQIAAIGGGGRGGGGGGGGGAGGEDLFVLFS